MTTIELVPMNEAAFADYYKTLVTDYAAEKVRAGNWSEDEAPERAREETGKLLPDGVHSPDQHLFTIRDDDSDEDVGVLWFAVQEHPAGARAFIYDIQIDEQFRRRGYASRALEILEEKARAMNLAKIGLHVFGDNEAAQALYKKQGYAVTNVLMEKTIDEIAS